MTAATKANRSGPPRMPNNILLKLFGFSILLFVAPILSFFLSKNYLFSKNAELYGGIIAVIMVNLVILVYILMIFNDDEEMEVNNSARKDKKLKQKSEESDESKDSEKSGKKENGNTRKRKV